MAKISITWIVKNTKGQIKGPYTTIEVMKYISSGVFTGEEKISQYPGGSWISISKEPQFYEKILEFLEAQVSGNDKKNQKSEDIKPEEQKNSAQKLDETVIIPYELSENNKDNQIVSNNDFINFDNKTNTGISKTKLTQEEIKKLVTESKSEIVELKNITQEAEKEKLNILRWPVFVGVAIIAVGLVIYGLFFNDDESSKEKIHLLAPKNSVDKLDQTQINKKTAEALARIGEDTFEGYVEAQNILIYIIENSIKNLKPRMLLCLTYKELWPFAKQDQQDQKVISYLAKTTKMQNKIDASGFICDSVKLYTEGRLQETLGVLDSVLEKDFTNFFLYQFKGEILEHQNENLIAESFYQKAKELAGKWVKPFFTQAMVNMKLKEYTKSTTLFAEILKINKHHKSSYFGLGILEFQRGQYDRSFDLLTSGLEIGSLIEKNLESQGIEALAEIYLIKGNKSKALKMANLNLKKNPSRKSALDLCNRLGGCDKISVSESKPDEELLFNCQMLLRQKDYLQAQAECKAAFDLNNKNSMAALKAAEALWGLGQGLEAINWIEKSLAADNRNVKAYLKRADFLSQRFDFQEAEKSLIQADFISKGNYEVQRGFAELAFKKKDYQGTRKLAEKALKLFDADIDSIILFSAASRELASNFRVGNQKDQEARQKIAQDAFNYSLKAIELDATNAEAQINYAKILALRQGVDTGANYLNELIKKFPTVYDYRIALAEVFMNEERFRQAAEELEKVISLNEKNKRAMMTLGKCYTQLGRAEDARSAFLKSSYLDPSDAEPVFEIAKIYLDTSRFNEAKTQFDRVIKLNSRFPRAHLYLGRTYLFNGNFTEAEKNAEIEKKSYPGLVESYLLIAEIKYASKNFSDCAAEYSKATKLGAQSVNVFVKAAKCYRLSGQVDMAQSFVDLAAERESGYEETYKEQGAIFEAKGDRLAAMRSYCKYVELSPNSKDKNEVLNQVSILGGHCGD